VEQEINELRDLDVVGELCDLYLSEGASHKKPSNRKMKNSACEAVRREAEEDWS
jgi:hypothetical protein